MKLKRTARVLFLAICLFAFWYGSQGWDAALPQYKHETVLIPWSIVTVLGLPSSYLYQFIVSLLADTFSVGGSYSGYANWVIWEGLPIALIGYFQWFRLLPWLIRKFRRR